MPTIWRRWRRWYASRRSSSAFVSPHVPMLYINTGTTKDSYNRSRNGRLIRDCLNHTVDSLQNATFASCFRRATSSASPSSNASLRVMHHSSSTRSACRQTLDRSVLDALMVSDHSAKGSSIIVIIFTSVHSVRWGEGVKGDRTLFLNVVYSDGNEIIAHVRRTSMTKNPLVRNSLLVHKLVT